MQQELDNTVSEILSGVQSGWSDAEKVLYLHDYLAEHCEYDLTYTYNDAYAALCGGTAVCQGYALAMCILCRELDIPCYPITSDTLKHMWNVVQIGGEWYQLDATYDDGAPDMLGRATHMYVLVNDAYMQADPYHAASDWNYFSEGTQITCTDAQYNNAFWYYVMDTMHPMPDGTWYYAEAVNPNEVQYASDVKATIYRGNASGTEAIRTVSAAWSTTHNTVYSLCYVATQLYGDKVYYFDPTGIYEMSLDGTTVKKIYTLTAEEKALGEIYGMRIDENGLLTYQIMAAPAFASEDDLTIDVTFHTIQLGNPEPEETTVTESETTTTTTTSTTTTTTTTTSTTTTTTMTTTTTTTTTSATTTTTPTTTTTTVTTTETTTAPETTVPTETHTTATTRRSGRTTTTLTETTVTEPETTTESTTTVTEPTAAETTVTETAAVPETSAETTTETTAAETEAPVSVLRGDVNANGIVDVSDAVLLARLVAEDQSVRISTQGLLNADSNSDGMRDHNDVLWILRFIARLL